ncbi:penicillin acylase family protein [Pleomorphovibrio marinus]|uniref:penicillin acylase family protein n=1 Tax=Pleomorphovibrio marinus TaxID=2164132 RepID=UPI000E0C0DBF|nr:penicillin acylase family protein [Pleomorphovibrio marinus]
MKKHYLLVLFVCLLVFPLLSQTEEERWSRHVDNTEIIRDQWGVPHVYGKTDADAIFGMLYAQCEDDFNRVEVNYITSLGRMAEVEGEDKLFTDLRMRFYIDEDVLKSEYDSSPEWLKRLMDAFADGINYYLHTHPEVTPKLLEKFEPWMALSFTEGSIGGDIETISPAGLEQFYDDPFQSYTPSPRFLLDENPSGSNGFAIAPSLTENGNALLLINPHTSFYFRPEIHTVSEEGLNAYGAVTWGQFFIYQGFNPYNGWMHTSTRADAIDHFSLEVRPAEQGYEYRHGDQWKPFEEKEITLSYRIGVEMNTKTFTAYYSHHGPVIRSENDRWVAIGLMEDRENALTQSYLRTKTTNHEEFRELMHLKTNSSNNTVYADKDGTIAYYHGNFIPRRNPTFDWSGTVDGSDPATDWDGLHEVDELVQLINPSNGWIQNCNSTPFTAAGDQSPNPEDYPSYMAPDSENARGLNAVRVLEGKEGFNLEKLVETAYDPYLIGFEKLLPSLFMAYENSDEASKAGLEDPISELKGWDLKFGLAPVGMTLAHYWGEALRTLARGIPMPKGVYLFDFLAENTSDHMKLEALRLAVERLENDFGTWRMAWGEVNRFQRLTGDIIQPFDDEKASIPVPFAPGLWGALASYVGRSPIPTKKIYGTLGNSFVAVVEFGEKVKAKSILAGGQSGDPDSPHFIDQAAPYAKGEFKAVNFYREEVENNASVTYKPGEK